MSKCPEIINATGLGKRHAQSLEEIIVPDWAGRIKVVRGEKLPFPLADSAIRVVSTRCCDDANWHFTTPEDNVLTVLAMKHDHALPFTSDLSLEVWLGAGFREDIKVKGSKK